MKLPIKTLAAIDCILQRNPKAVFCGSVALVALGLLQRTPKDVDILTTIKDLKKIDDLNKWYTCEHYPEVREGRKVDRRPLQIKNYGDGCAFVVQSYGKTKTVKIDGRTIRVQDPKEIIEAKRMWASVPKHAKDLDALGYEV